MLSRNQTSTKLKSQTKGALRSSILKIKTKQNVLVLDIQSPQ